MYTKFYGLDEKPFALVPDPRYLYLGRSHREALAHLLYGIEQGEGFIQVTGLVGTGKTTLCRTLMEQVGSDVELGFIFNPSSSELELLAAINKEFGLPSSVRTRTELIDELNRFLLEKKANGHRILLVIDEAQNLEPEILEQVRLLSNLETEREKLLQIVLLGQPELEETLSQPDLRQLRQRITVRWRLEPFRREETAAYVVHRLKVSGAATANLFTRLALRQLHRASRGVPRVINALADRSLLAGFSAGKRRISARLVRSAARELPGSDRPRSASSLDLRPLPATILVVLGVIAGLGVVAFDPRARPPEVSSAALGPSETPAKIAPLESPLGYASVSEPERYAAPPPSIDQKLLGRNSDSTAAHAIDVVLEIWGYEPLGADGLSPNAFASAVRQVSPMRVFATRATPDQLAALNLPVIVELEPEPDERRYAAVTELEDGRAVLSAAGQTFEIGEAELERLWTGRAFFVWSNFESVPVLAPGMNGTAVRWLQARLTDLSYLQRGEASGEFDARTTDAIRRFQRRYALEATGEVGPETLIALYQALHYGAPRLASAGGVS